MNIDKTIHISPSFSSTSVRHAITESVANIKVMAEDAKMTIEQKRLGVQLYFKKEWNKEKAIEKTKSGIRNWVLSHNPFHIHDNQRKKIGELKATRCRLLNVAHGLLKKLKSIALPPETRENINNRVVEIYKNIKKIDKNIHLIEKDIKCQNFQYAGRWANKILPGSGLIMNFVGLGIRYKNAGSSDVDENVAQEHKKSIGIQAIQCVLCTALIFGLNAAKQTYWDSPEN